MWDFFKKCVAFVSVFSLRKFSVSDVSNASFAEIFQSVLQVISMYGDVSTEILIKVFLKLQFCP